MWFIKTIVIFFTVINVGPSTVTAGRIKNFVCLFVINKIWGNVKNGF